MDQNNQMHQTISASKVLIVNNIPANTYPYLLFKLFGLYGNVKKVKIMLKKRDTALIEFQDLPQA